jgi:hypothetical protein
MALSSPGGMCLPKWSGSWHLVAREPSWFLCLMWSGDAMHGLGVWRGQSFASSWWFFLLGVSPLSLQDFILGSMLSASSLSRRLGFWCPNALKGVCYKHTILFF